MSIDFRVIDNEDDRFSVHANEPITVEVTLNEGGRIIAHVYRGDSPDADAEPVGGYDGSYSDNSDWVVDPHDSDEDVVVVARPTVGSPTLPQAHPRGGSSRDLDPAPWDYPADDWYEGVCANCARLIHLREGYRWFHANSKQTACQS